MILLKSLVRHVIGYSLLPVFFLSRIVLEQLTEIKPVRNLLADHYQLLKSISKAQTDEEIKHRYRMESTVRWGEGTLFYGKGSIEVGEQTYFGKNCYISANPESVAITIGKNCAISHNVHIRTAGYNTDLDFEEARKAERIAGNIKVGDNVWIGANSFICGGVEIAANSIIGANSVVTKNVPANAIFGGVPAKLIRYKQRVNSS